MPENYTLFADLAQEVQPPADGIVSRTLHDDEKIKAVLFGFGAGQELSEHTASKPALLQFVRGEAELTFGDDRIEATAGTWARMDAGLPHSVKAKTETVMLLLLLK